jgi:hypothetical protein
LFSKSLNKDINTLLLRRNPPAYERIQGIDLLVKYSRTNFLTPVPHAASFDALNAMLEERCRARQAERAGRHEQTIGERLVAD